MNRHIGQQHEIHSLTAPPDAFERIAIELFGVPRLWHQASQRARSWIGETDERYRGRVVDRIGRPLIGTSSPPPSPPPPSPDSKDTSCPEPTT